MNNYSSLQRFWHQFSLSHAYIRQMSFDLERSIFLDNSFPVKDNHVFVAALARAGTTSLLTAIHDSDLRRPGVAPNVADTETTFDCSLQSQQD